MLVQTGFPGFNSVIYSNNFLYMKNRFLLFLVFGVFQFFSVHSQSLTPTVIASSGGYYVSGSGSLSVTAAEMCMIETYSTATVILTQGFIQPAESFAGIEEIPVVFDAFPNPTNGRISLAVNSDNSGPVLIRLINMAGMVVFSVNEEAVPGPNTFDIDISNFDPGVYLLGYTLFSTSGDIESGTVKINLLNE
ncbi:hypothetical protein SDC9_58336 [bioreactor metagenome]|uniref:Secretion system C-terminal sorting domain-containing protein n=1 Tax=bioreactor metagenome TaxID=1076179 RepID=A0A644X751_9ZZZZ